MIETPSVESLVLKVDGGYAGRVVVEGGEEAPLDIGQIARVINLLDSGKNLTVGT